MTATTLLVGCIVMLTIAGYPSFNRAMQRHRTMSMYPAGSGFWQVFRRERNEFAMCAGLIAVTVGFLSFLAVRLY